jgi:hypothetical protein
MHGKSPSIIASSPEANATLGLCKLSEDESESHIDAAHREEEKRGDKRKSVNVMGENRSSDA